MNETNAPRAHLAGVAGVGMSALAQALLDAGWTVSGSDRYLDQGRPIEVLDTLRAAGVTLLPQDGSGVTPGLDALVVSTAVEPGHPELEAAARQQIPVVHRAEMLARLAAGSGGVAVAGTSGKTTVTGLLGWLLEQTGADPTVVNGGIVLDWATPCRVGNTRRGRSDCWVFEADESDRSLLRYAPDWAIITNVSHDHFSLNETVGLFLDFAAKVRIGLVLGPQAARTLRAAGLGRAEATHLELVEPGTLEDAGYAPAGWGGAFTYAGRRFEVSLPGRHNAENALLAVAQAARLGADLDALRAALPAFRGIHRRLERVGSCGGALVIDEYAHNPAKLRAAWETAAAAGGRVFGVWRPHGFGPLAQMFDDLVSLFAECARLPHRLYLLPVYYAGGTANGRRSSSDLAEALGLRGVRVELMQDYGPLEAALRPELREGDVLLVMGARDPELTPFARRMAGVPPPAG